MRILRKKLSVLLIGSSAATSIELMYLRAFKSSGYKNVYLFDIKKNFYFFQNKFLRKSLKFFKSFYFKLRLINLLKKKKYNYKVIIIFKGKEISFKTLEKIKRNNSNVIFININHDDPFNPEKNISNSNVIKSIKLYDLYFVWSKRIYYKLMRSKYNNIRYLPFGFDHTFHNLRQNKKNKIFKHILFIGSWDKNREFLLNKLGKFNIKIHGTGWNNASKKIKTNKNIFISYKEASPSRCKKEMSRAAVTLNILRKQNRTSHNMKTFEIPGMGGLMLTERSYEQNNFFPENKSSLMYTGLRELKKKILYAYNNKHVSNIRIAGSKVIKKHYYKNRVNLILDEIWKLKK